jgi:hypothetical protein
LVFENRFLNNFKEHVTNAGLNLDSLADSDDPFEYVKAFPVLKYLTLRRLTNDLDNLIDEMNGDLGESRTCFIATLKHFGNHDINV